MSGEDEDKDLELKDLIIQTLEANGLLAKMKAQIRASVFAALEENEKSNLQLQNIENQSVKRLISTNNGQICASLVKDFLESCNLDYTLSVFDPELNQKLPFIRRDKLISILKLNENSFAKNESPILFELLNNNFSGEKSTYLKTETSHFEIEEVEKKFQKLDSKGILESRESSSILEFEKNSKNDNSFLTKKNENEENILNFLNSKKNGEKFLNKIPQNKKTALVNKDKNSKTNDIDDDNYDDDFTSGTTPRTPKKEKKTLNQKNRAGISGASEEEIEDNLSYIEESSKIDEITNDRSISTIQGNNDADYIEDVSI